MAASKDRDYKKEYQRYHKSKKAKLQRARNNKANHDAGTYGNHDRKDVAHAKPGAKGATHLASEASNRSFERDEHARRKKKA